MQAGSVSLTYTHTTLSIVSETLEEVPAAGRGKPAILAGNQTFNAQHSSRARDGDVTYTASSYTKMQEAAAFYTATFGRDAINPFNSSFNLSQVNNSWVEPAQAGFTASGTMIQAAQRSLGSLIDILA